MSRASVWMTRPEYGLADVLLREVGAEDGDPLSMGAERSG